MKAESEFSIVACSECKGPCMAISYTGDVMIHHPICLECYQKLEDDKKAPNELDMIIPEEMSTEKAHEIQNDIDIVTDSLGDCSETGMLQLIRDKIPCHCGQEYSMPRRKRRR